MYKTISMMYKPVGNNYKFPFPEIHYYVAFQFVLRLLSKTLLTQDIPCGAIFELNSRAFVLFNN